VSTAVGSVAKPHFASLLLAAPVETPVPLYVSRSGSIGCPSKLHVTCPGGRKSLSSVSNVRLPSLSGAAHSLLLRCSLHQYAVFQQAKESNSRPRGLAETQESG